MNDDLLSLQIFLDRSKTRRLVLSELKEGEQVAIFLAKKHKIHRSAISRALTELSDKGLTECINPNDSNYRKYRITHKGKEVLNKI